MFIKKLRTGFFTYIKAIVFAVWTLGPGMLTANGRQNIWRIAQTSSLGITRIPTQFKQVDKNDIYGDLDVRLVLAKRSTGDVGESELNAISVLVRRYYPKRLFEIGTFRGRTTLHLALNSPPEAKVFTLDLPAAKANNTKFQLDPTASRYIQKERSGECFLDSQLPERSKITQLWGDSADFDYSPFMGTMDFVFVDGAHSYEYVVNDTKVAFSLLRARKGIIVWHDFARKQQPGVTSAIIELAKDPDYQIMSNCCWIRGTTLVYLEVSDCDKSESISNPTRSPE